MPEGMAGWEVRCSICAAEFLTPETSVRRRAQVLSKSHPHCSCGWPIEAKPRSESVLVHCPKCSRWLVMPKRAAPPGAPGPSSAKHPRRETSILTPVRPAGAGAGDDIERARNIVAQLLPTQAPSVPGMDIAAFSQFRHEVGGDYYDFLELPAGRMGIAIADVSGKGVGAALLMVRLREILHSVAPLYEGAAETVAAVNARLAPTTPRGTFVTFLYALLDPKAHELRVVNAGHCAPLVWRARLTGVRVLQCRGPALCLLDPEQFPEAISEGVVTLEPSDCLCLFTDGVSEAKDEHREDFGETRVAATLRQHAEGAAQQIADGIVAAVAAHTRSAPQHDDMTLIVLKAL